MAALDAWKTNTDHGPGMPEQWPLPRIPTGKWAKHGLLSLSPVLRTRLPLTNRFSARALWDCLQSCPCAVIKPEDGEGGSRVLRICRGFKGYVGQSGVRIWRAGSFSELFRTLPDWAVHRPAIVQRYLTLLPFRGRPADIRTIVQRDEAGRFELTGTFVKSAPPGRFVTNVKQGGSVDSLHHYLRHAVDDPMERVRMRREVEEISAEVGDFLGERYANSVFGIDLGFDRYRRLWVIEVNTQPSLTVLSRVDRSMLHRALALRRQTAPVLSRRDVGVVQVARRRAISRMRRDGLTNRSRIGCEGVGPTTNTVSSDVTL